MKVHAQSVQQLYEIPAKEKEGNQQPTITPTNVLSSSSSGISNGKLELKHSYEAFMVGYLDEEERVEPKKKPPHEEQRTIKPHAIEEKQNEELSKLVLSSDSFPWKYDDLEYISNLDIVKFLQRVASESFLVSNGLDGRLEELARRLSKGEVAKMYKTLVETKQYYSEEGSLFNRFPRELCIYIFDFLDWKSLCMAGMVCKSWNSAFEDMSHALLKQRNQKHTTFVLYLLKKIDAQIDVIIEEQAEAERLEKERKRRQEMMERRKEEMMTAYSASHNDLLPPALERSEEKKPFDMHSRNGTRIEFLKQTVLLLKDYFEKGAKAREEEEEALALKNFAVTRQRTTVLPEYVHLLRIVNKQLLETSSILVHVRKGTIRLNQNFDIIELSLRRYYAHFVLMFSPTGEASSLFQYPSEMIQDPRARAIWDLCVGRDKYFVDFDQFYEEVLLKEMGGTADENFRYNMQFFLNFPKDDTVTVSKWNLLTRLFGPYENFYQNFKTYVLGQGFLGLINRIRAEEILKDYPYHVLIRFSRTAPLVLAFSVSRGNYIQHYTNAPSQRSALGLEEGAENIPIATFLKEQFPDARLVPMRVDGKAVAHKDTLSHYCEQIAGYEVMS